MNDLANMQADPVEEALHWIVRLNSGAATPDDAAAYEAVIGDWLAVQPPIEG